jgi:hypothetical protein
MRRTAIVLAAGLVLAGCGGSSSGSPEEEVKDLYVDFVEALIDEETGDACAMTTDVGSCLGAIAFAQGFLGESGYESILPDDWRDSIEDAEVTFSDDDHATIPPLTEDEEPTEFVREEGEWKLVMEDLSDPEDER